MKKIILTLITLIIFYLWGSAQDHELEKTYDLMGLADIGDIANFQFDVATNTYEITYILLQSPGKVRVEQYTFDKDYNFLKENKEDLDAEAAGQKYPWWNYRGEKYQDGMVSVDEKDRVVVRNQVMTYTYNWKKMVYTYKPAAKEYSYITADNGEYYFHYRNWWTAEDLNNIYILCAQISKEDDLNQCKNFHFIKMSKSKEVLKDLEIRFDYPQEVVFPRFVDDKSESRFVEKSMEEGIFCLFAPKNMGKKVSDPQPTNYTYIRLDKDLNIVDRIAFVSPANFWSVDDYINDENSGCTYFLGASLMSTGKYFDDLTNTKVFGGFQVMKISGHKVDYVTNTGLGEFSAKKILPPSEKKGDSYDGKKVLISNYTVTPEGILMVAGQSYSSYRNAQTLEKIVTYGDCFAFAVDPMGSLLSQYIFNWRGYGSNLPAFQELFAGNNPSNIYWLIMVPVYTKIEIWGGFGPSWVDICASEICKIDLKSNSMTNFYNHQVDKEAHKFYYLSSTMPYYITEDHKLMLFGSQSMSGGKRLWFARIPLD